MKNNSVRELSGKQQVVKRGGGLASSTLSTLIKAVRNIPVGAVVNSVIDALPVELHLPGNYNFCGPGTQLKKRLERRDKGINKLDQYCRDHDIAYSKYSDTENRSKADQILADQAWQRVKSSDASVGERAAALAVTAAMKGKRAIGGGRRRRRRLKGVKRGGNIRNKRTLFQSRPHIKKKVEGEDYGELHRPAKVFI